MDISSLKELGLNHNEAIVFHTLIHFIESDARNIIEKTKFHKNIVYDNLQKLIDKGLVTYIDTDNRRIYQLASPNMLTQMIEDDIQGLEQKRKKAEALEKEIQKIKRSVDFYQKASVYRGTKGIRSFYEDTLLGGGMFIFGGHPESVRILGETFWRNYMLKRESKKILAKMIFNPSLREYGNSAKSRFTKIRFFSEFEPLTETHIQDDTVAIIVWTEEPILFMMQDPNVAFSYKTYFDLLWKQAEK